MEDVLTPEMVFLIARDREGNVVQKTQIPLYDWYEDIHPLIDDPCTRQQLGVASIEGVEVNLAGEVQARWRNTYDEAGELLELQELD